MLFVTVVFIDFLLNVSFSFLKLLNVKRKYAIKYVQQHKHLIMTTTALPKKKPLQFVIQTFND